MPSSIIRQLAMRRWPLYAPRVASCRSGCPRRLRRSKLRLAIPEDRVLLVTGAQTWATATAGAQGRRRLSISVGTELWANTDALSCILRRGASTAVIGKAQHCASTLDIQDRRRSATAVQR